MDRLYGLPLREFTQARNELARQVRRDDREAGDEIRRLKKPSAAAWTVNQLARTRREDVDALLAAGAALRQAQQAVGDRAAATALRASGEDERVAVDRLVRAARELLPSGSKASPTLERVRNTLHAAASDEELREQLERGRVTADREPVGFGVDLGSAPPRRPPRGERGARSRQLRAARSEEQSAKRSLSKAEAALDLVRNEAEDVRRRLEAAEQALSRARQSADDAAARIRELDPQDD